MKSLPGSQPLLGEIPPKLVAGILGRSYDATPCLARSGSWFWRRGSWWWCRPRLLTSSLLLCSPRFLSAPALPYSSSFCSLVLLNVSFFFFCLFSLPLPFLLPLHWLRVVLLLSLVHSGGFAVTDEEDSVEGLFHQHCFLSSCCFLCFFLCYPVPPPPFLSPHCHLSSLISPTLRFGSSSSFYSQRTQAFCCNGRRASQWQGMSAAKRAPWLKLVTPALPLLQKPLQMKKVMNKWNDIVF